MKDQKTIVELKGRKVELSTTAAANWPLLRALEEIYHSNRRVRIWYGDTTTGRSWNDEFDVTGTISTSTGEVACLILLRKISSFGGGALLDSSIVRIDDIAARKTIYKHPQFNVQLKVEDLEVIDTTTGNVQARFDNRLQADNYYKFMIGERYSK